LFFTLESSFHKILVRSNDNIILNAIYENLSPLLDQSLSYSYATTEEYEKNGAILNNRPQFVLWQKKDEKGVETL
jgi:DNA-binding FadR family transcriptional regulator